MYEFSITLHYVLPSTHPT